MAKTIQIRRGNSAEWKTVNPMLAAGEYGLEVDTGLLKIGNGSLAWNSLRYLNKLDPSYFEYNENGEITFSAAFYEKVDEKVSSGGTVETLIISNNPTEPLEAANKQYVDQTIAELGMLKRRVVTTLPNAENADENTIYLIKQGDYYHEYYLIDDRLEEIGTGASIEPATDTTLGGVKSSPDIKVGADGFMTIQRVSTSTLYTPIGDSLVIYSGNAS